MGLLWPTRATGDRRRYDRSDLRRVAAILVGKEAGLSLTDIRAILTVTDIEQRREIQRRHCDELLRRLQMMWAALNLIEGGLNCGHEDITACPNYQSLVADRMTSAANRRTVVRSERRCGQSASVGTNSRW